MGCPGSRLTGPKPKEMKVEASRIDYLIRTSKVEKLSLQPISRVLGFRVSGVQALGFWGIFGFRVSRVLGFLAFLGLLGLRALGFSALGFRGFWVSRV